VATATAAIVLLTPANFYHFRRPKFNFQLLSFTFETFGKKLAETKIYKFCGLLVSRKENICISLVLVAHF